MDMDFECYVICVFFLRRDDMVDVQGYKTGFLCVFGWDKSEAVFIFCLL